MAQDDLHGWTEEQAKRCRKLFAAIAMQVMDEHIYADHRARQFKRKAYGAKRIRAWAMSRDGRTILSCAGINPSEHVADKLAAYVARGITTTRDANLKVWDRPSRAAKNNSP